MNKKNAFVITVIIPAYNCDKFIERCISNLLRESLNQIEILVINDGSSDKTLEKLEKYSEKIKIISKPNGGVSSARNVGIKNASGRYITFLDADDEIPSGVLSKYIEIINNNSDMELLQGCFDDFDDIKDVYTISSSVMRKICLGYPQSLNQFFDIKYEVKAGVHGCYGKLFELDIVKEHNLKFNESFGLGEDLLFYFDYLDLVKEVYILERKTYTINCEVNSATRGVNKKMPLYALEFSKCLLSKVKRQDDLYPEACYQINMHVNKAFSSYFGNPLNKDKNKLKQFKDYLKNPCIYNTYCFLEKNEKSILHKVKYWLLMKKFVGVYFIFEKKYSSFICRRGR